MSRIPLRPWLWTAVLASSGCFTYVPIETSAAPAGGEVRVELTRVGFAELPELPSWSGPDLAGTLVRADRDQLLLAVPVAVRSNGVVLQTIEQQVTIPTRSIVQMERRQLNRRSTILAIGGGLATLGGVFLGFKAGGNGTPEIPDPPVEEEAGTRILSTIFSLPVHFLP